LNEKKATSTNKAQQVKKLRDEAAKLTDKELCTSSSVKKGDDVDDLQDDVSFLYIDVSL